MGFGPTNNTLSYNANKLNVKIDEIDSIAISHFHSDHMGGIDAFKEQTVKVPEEFIPKSEKVCYLPKEGQANGFFAEQIHGPQVLSGGIVTTGPLSRSLFILGPVEEQALIINLKGKGLVIFTGCGHPTIEVILKMVRKISDEPIVANGR